MKKKEKKMRLYKILMLGVIVSTFTLPVHAMVGLGTPSFESHKKQLGEERPKTCVDFTGVWKASCKQGDKPYKDGLEVLEQDKCQSIGSLDYTFPINTVTTITRMIPGTPPVLETVTHLATWNENGTVLKQVERALVRPITHDAFEPAAEKTIDVVEIMQKVGDKIVNTITRSDQAEKIVCEFARTEIQ